MRRSNGVLDIKEVTWLGYVGVFVLVFPVILTVFLALFGQGAGERVAFVQPVLFDRLVNSAAQAMSAALISLLIGACLALVLARRRFPGVHFVPFLALLPLLIPPHIHAVGWLRSVGNTGWLSTWFIEQGYQFNVRRGFVEIAGDPTFYPGTIGILVSSFWPLAYVSVAAGMARLDPRSEETAALAGVSGYRRWGLLLSMIAPHLKAGFFLVFIMAIGCYAVPLLLDTPTVMQQIFFPTSNVDALAGAVVALPLVVLTLVSLWLVARSFSAARYVSGVATSKHHTHRKSFAVGVLVWAWLLFAVGWPVFSLALKATGDNQAHGVVDSIGFFLRATFSRESVYAQIFLRVKDNIFNSLAISAVAAFSLGMIGTALALLIHTRRGLQRGFLEAAALLPFAFPAVVVGVALNRFWGHFSSLRFVDEWIYNGFGVAVLVPMTLFLPFVVRSVQSTLTQIPNGAFEFAEIAGLSRRRVFLNILLPLLKPGVLAGMVLAFVLSMGELAGGLVAAPGTWQTGQVRVFNMIHFSRDEEVAALCLMMAGLGLVPMVAYSLWSNRRLEVV